MTLDQTFFRLCDIELLKKPIGHREKKKSASSQSPVSSQIPATPEGMIKVRTSDGTIKFLPRTGESLNRRLMRERKEKQELEQKKRQEEKRNRNKRRRR